MKKDGPTPDLGKPNRNMKMFTHSENKLLDQITIEIMESWKKDLMMMRQHYKQVVQAAESVKDVSELVEEKFPLLEGFLQSNDSITAISRIESDIASIKGSFGELLHSLSNAKNEEVTKSDIQAIQKKSESLEKMLIASKQDMAELKKNVSLIKGIYVNILEKAANEKSHESWWKKLCNLFGFMK